MSSLVDKIKAFPQIFHSSRSKMVRVWEAEDRLGITFPDAFQAYLCHFGAIGFRDVEWTGLNVEPDLNVVRATLGARERDPDFPAGCFVLRPADKEGCTVFCDEAERIFRWQPEDSETKQKLLCESLEAYFELCLREAGMIDD